MRYVLDTNTLSLAIHQRRGYESIFLRMEGLEYGQLLISAITLSEIQTMIAKAADPAGKERKVWQLIRNFHVVDFGEIAALHAGQIRAWLESRGQKIGPLDTLIAAHARSLGAVVVTDNVDEFSRVPGLSVENWYGRS